MEDIMKKRAKDSVGKDVKIILESNYIYKGKLLECDEKYIELLDYKTNSIHVFDFGNIKDLEVFE